MVVHVQLAVYQDPQVLFRRATPQSGSPQPESLQEVTPFQVQDFTLLLKGVPVNPIAPSCLGPSGWQLWDEQMHRRTRFPPHLTSSW